MKQRISLDSSILPDLKGLSVADVSVLLALLIHHSAERGCWPSQERIADVTGLHRITVTRSIKRLEAAGYLLVERHGRRCRYRLPVNDRNHLLGGCDRWQYVAALLHKDDSTCSETATSYVAKWLHACNNPATCDVATSLHANRTRARNEHTKKNILKEQPPRPAAERADSLSIERGKKKPNPTPRNLLNPEQQEIYDRLHKSITKSIPPTFRRRPEKSG